MKQTAALTQMRVYGHVTQLLRGDAGQRHRPVAGRARAKIAFSLIVGDYTQCSRWDARTGRAFPPGATGFSKVVTSGSMASVGRLWDGRSTERFDLRTSNSTLRNFHVPYRIWLSRWILVANGKINFRISGKWACSVRNTADKRLGDWEPQRDDRAHFYCQASLASHQFLHNLKGW